MQILSKLTATAVLVSSAAAQGVYISPGSAYFQPGTFGQTFSDGSYISAGVAQKPGEYNDISYAAQNGGPAANTQYGAGVQQNFPGGFPGGFGGYQNSFPPQQPFGGYGGPAPYPAPPSTGFTPPPPPTYSAGTQGFLPPPPPTYVAGTNGPSDSNGPPPLVQVGQDIHTGGFHKRDVAKTESAKQYWPSLYRPSWYNSWFSGPQVTVGQPTAYFAPGTFGTTFSDGGYTSWGVPRPYKTKRSVETTEKAEKAEQWPGYYNAYGSYGSYGGYGSNYYNNWFGGPTVTIGQPTAYFQPGTFGTTFSDGSYISAGVPRPFKKLNKRQVITAGGYFGGPTVSIGAPTAYFAPGTFGQTFSDGGYTSWGVPSYTYPTVYKREVSTPSAGGVEGLSVDGSRSSGRVNPDHGYGRPAPPFAAASKPQLAAEYNSFGYTTYSSNKNSN